MLVVAAAGSEQMPDLQILLEPAVQAVEGMAQKELRQEAMETLIQAAVAAGLVNKSRPLMAALVALAS
jgi:hypothetical protein